MANQSMTIKLPPGTTINSSALTHTTDAISYSKLNLNNTVTGSVSSDGINIYPTIFTGSTTTGGTVYIDGSSITNMYPNINASSGTLSKSSKDGFYDKEELMKNLQQKMDEVEKMKIELQDQQHAVDECNFDKGGIAFHKVYGNVVIRGFTQEYGSYSIRVKIVGAFDGEKEVLLTELLPINDMTKVLYNDPNQD